MDLRRLMETNGPSIWAFSNTRINISVLFLEGARSAPQSVQFKPLLPGDGGMSEREGIFVGLQSCWIPQSCWITATHTDLHTAHV